MINGIYLSTMGAMVQATRHATIANNLANVNTTGFKPDWARFRHIPSESEWNPDLRFTPDEVLRRTGGGAWMESTATNLVQGPPQVTGNPFDVYLNDETSATGGVGFFMVRPAGAPEGTVEYTRAGHFVYHSDGTLRSPNGDTLLSPDGAPIRLALEPGVQVHVEDTGLIRGQGPDGNMDLGQIGVVETGDRMKMVKVGDSRFRSEGAELSPRAAGVVGGALEASAANPIREMVDMIEAQRAYDLNMKFITIQDETLASTVRRVTAVG